jgi:hypothetical protein
LFRTTLKQGRVVNVEEEGPKGLKKASHAGIIRIGFEGIFSAPRSRSTPVSIHSIETLIRRQKQIGRRHSVLRMHPVRSQNIPEGGAAAS